MYEFTVYYTYNINIYYIRVLKINLKGEKFMSNLTKIMYPNNRKEDQYEALLSQIKTHFHEIMDGYPKLWLYKTDVTDLFQVFLDNLPADAVQHYTCNACRRFVNKYGSLVSITENGDIIPVMWPTPGAGIFSDAVEAVREYLITKAKVICVFYSDKTILGTPQTGDWSHMSVQINRRLFTNYHVGVYGKNCGQMMSASVHDYVTLRNAIKDYDISVVTEAMKLINSGALYRSDKVKDACNAFRELLESLKGETPKVKHNKIWYYIANATDARYLHIKSSVLGTLLDDIKNGVEVDTIISKFNDKMDPMHYQRPQAAPSTGNIDRAEQIFAELGFTNKSLERRFASVDELETVWRPDVCKEDNTEEQSSVFGRLRDQAKNALKISKTDKLIVDRGSMTWNKFYTEILPHAKKLRIRNTHYLPTPIIATFLTAVNPDDKCIFRYGNHFSYYMYNKPMGISFGILGDVEVLAISYDPELWGKKDDMINGDTNGITLILKGAKDLQRIGDNKIAGTGIFPEDLIPEFREIRSTIAAYSSTDYIQDSGVGYATGVRLQRGINYYQMINLIVETDTMGTLSLNIDRWE